MTDWEPWSLINAELNVDLTALLDGVAVARSLAAVNTLSLIKVIPLFEIVRKLLFVHFIIAQVVY